MPPPTISPDPLPAWIAEISAAVQAAQASSRCEWESCGRYARHSIPDWGYYCDRHLISMKNKHGRDFTYQVRRGKTQKVVKYDMWADGDIEYGTAASS